MDLFEESELRRGEIQRHKENAARMAFAFARYRTTGQGPWEFEKRVDFDLTFIEKPYVSYGAELDLDELEDLLGQESELNDVPAMPVSTGYVTKWDQDEREMYVGCWVAAVVSFPPYPVVDATIMPNVIHHFTFAAIAMKDVPSDVDD